MLERTCRISRERFVIEKEDLEFYAKMGVISDKQLKELMKFQDDDSISISDKKILAKLLIGLPTLSPTERQKRRLSWRNERTLYQRDCDLCKKSMISIYDKKTIFPVYCQNCWWSDKWDANKYEKEFNFNKPFFEQFKELMVAVPNLSLVVLNSENSEYNNYAVDCKNAYLSFRVQGEDIMYSYLAVHNCRDCVDCYNLEKSELCYEVIDGKNCYDVSFSRNVENCSESSYLFNCKSCKNCAYSSNLRGKEYYFCNKKLSKEEYIKAISELKMSEIKTVKYKQFFNDFIKRESVPYLWGSMFENSTGNHLIQAKNCQNCYDCWETEDLKYSGGHSKGKDSMDTDYYFHGNNSLETISVTDSNYLYFCYGIWNGGANLFYSFSCTNNTQDCFGCVGLKHKNYCILNKQYNKEEYFELKEKIIEYMKSTGEWGEFFPTELSPFAYNETVAQEYFPLTKEEVMESGYEWKNVIEKNYRAASTEKIPQSIKDVEESICKETLACRNCQKNYKIQKAELKFYKKMDFPIPIKCPDCRHADRMGLRNPRKLWKRNCKDCDCEIQTTFAPERPEKILCEKCYLKVVD